MKMKFDKSKTAETLATLAFACLLLQLWLADKLALSAVLHVHFFLLCAVFLLALNLLPQMILAALLVVSQFYSATYFSGIALYVIGGALFLLSFFSLKGDEWLARLWLQLGEAMGFVVSKVVLIVVFFVCLTPLALLYRLFNKKQLSTKQDATNFVQRGHRYEKKDLNNTW